MRSARHGKTAAVAVPMVDMRNSFRTGVGVQPRRGPDDRDRRKEA
jgi:hypothetical protein